MYRVIGFLSPDIELTFSVLFVAPLALALALALGKNNTNMLLKIKFQ
jgi:hypothetical protein